MQQMNISDRMNISTTIQSFLEKQLLQQFQYSSYDSKFIGYLKFAIVSLKKVKIWFISEVSMSSSELILISN